jgi:hypothetical protein
VEHLYEAIKERHEAIQRAIETYRLLNSWATLASLAISSGKGNFLIDSSRLEAILDGVSGSYFLLDDKGERKFVIKPIDEDAGALNNPKGFATPFAASPLRNHMPLYLSSLREALTYQIGMSIGVSEIAPKTMLAILESSGFSYLIDRISPSEIDRYLEHCGPDLREKLCSVQEYVNGAKTLFEAQQELQMGGLSDEEIANRFDTRDFEDANILIWTTYDTDAHAGNILVYPKGTDAIGTEILGFKKIDNGLAFPDKNKQLHNALSYLPNAKRSLSEEAREKIAALDIEALSEQLIAYGLESAVHACKRRIVRLQQLAARPGITLYEINKKMAKT